MVVRNDGGIIIYGILITLLILAGMIAFYISAKSSDFYENGPSGIAGNVTLGPTCPVQRINETCEEPYQADIAIKSESGEELAKVRSDENGKFRISLPPGTYILVPLSSSTLPRASPETVTVKPGKFTEITISYDTGIR